MVPECGRELHETDDEAARSILAVSDVLTA